MSPLERLLAPPRATPALGRRVALFAAAYGLVMGSYNVIEGGGLLQPLWSAVKMPLLFLGTFGLGYPLFWVLSSLLGLREDAAEVRRAIVGAQASIALVLVALSPLTLVAYASTADYDLAVLFNGAVFLVASGAGQLVLRRAYAPLVARRSAHRAGLTAWLVIYVLVGIQMGWVLRPFVGRPDLPVTFWRGEALGNAYLDVWAKLSGTLGRR